MQPMPSPAPLTSPVPKAKMTLSILGFMCGLYPFLLIPLTGGLAVLGSVPDVIFKTLFLLTLPAVVFAIISGHIVLAQTGHSPQNLAQRGFAIAALSLGYVVIGIIVLFIVIRLVSGHLYFA